MIPVACTSPDVVSKFFRLILYCSDLRGLDAGIQVIRPKSGWTVHVAGPAKAYSCEKVVFVMKQGIWGGVLAAANHFVDGGWHLDDIQPETAIGNYDRSFSGGNRDFKARYSLASIP